MNKHQEALKTFKHVIRKLCSLDDTYYQEEFELEEKALQELVDKATPKKPTLFKPLKTFNGSEIEQPFYIIKCGKCEYWLEQSDKFCSNCGTEIDWNGL